MPLPYKQLSKQKFLDKILLVGLTHATHARLHETQRGFGVVALLGNRTSQQGQSQLTQKAWQILYAKI